MSLYLIDASVFVFRAWYSIPDSMTDDEGRPINAAYGFARFLAEFLESAGPELVAVAFDESLTHSHRNEIYPDYKANRDPAPEELKRQFGLCRDLVGAMGLRDLGSDRYEADDIIGTLVERARERELPVVVVTRDKDLSQLLRDGDTYWDYAGGERVPYAAARDRFGALPERMADYLALTGDKVDNIPGIPGIGPKTASILMHHFDGLDELYRRIDEVPGLKMRGAARVAERLREHEAAARLARQLTDIYREVPLEVGIDDLRWVGPDLERLEAFCSASGLGDGVLRRARSLIEARAESR